MFLQAMMRAVHDTIRTFVPGTVAAAVMMRAVHETMRTSVVGLVAVAVTVLLLHAPPAVAQSVPQASAQTAASAAAPQGSLSGAVVADSSDLPLANAEITFPALKLAARTDSKGNFQIAGVPAGSHELLVRLLGYQPFAATMTFRSGQNVEVDFMLKRNVTVLANVNVKSAVNPLYASRLVEFEERRKFGFGKFLTSDFFEREGIRLMSAIVIERIGGLRTTGGFTEQVLETKRYGISCPVQVIVNGMVMYSGRPLEQPFDINSISADQVIGLEYYSLANTPAQLMNTSGAARCGTVVIWRK